MIPIIFAVTGILVFLAGLYYLAQNKDDAESRKIYGITAFLGAVIAAVSIAMLVL